MKTPMHHSRSESGFALIEVVVSAAVLAIVALAVLSGLDAANGASAREKARAVGASLAEKDQERLRTLSIDTIGNPPQQGDVTVDGATYKIQSQSEWITDDVNGTPACGTESSQVQYVHITTTVTSSIIGTRVKPIKIDSLVAPTTKWAEGHGTLGVKVVDRSASKGVPNIAVRAASTGYTPAAETTDANGCVVFDSVPVGTYTITLNTPGFIDRDGNQSTQTTMAVVAKKVGFATMSYDKSTSAMVSVTTHIPHQVYAVARVKPSKAGSVSAVNGASVGFVKTWTPSSPATSIPAGGMFPFAQNSYAFFTGACKYAAPDSYTPANTDYFSQVNAAATLLSDPANVAQSATVRQPPFNIRILRGRNTTFTDGTIDVYATLKRPTGSTDACPEPVYKLTTTAWPTSGWGTEPETGGHWVSQAGAGFDPGMPFGKYSICLRDNGQGWTYGGSDYDNTTQNGVQTTLQISGPSNSNSWNTTKCSYSF
jgi:type II secretory pathway pseudopilin PulG